MHKNFFIDVITRKPALFEAILRFNGQAAAGEDVPGASLPDQARDLCAGLPEEVLNELADNPRARRHICALARNGDAFWDFAEESRCLALLPPDTLIDLARFYGAGLHAEEMARTILGREVAALRESLGEDAYLYAIRRGQYQTLAGRELFTARHKDMALAERAGLHGREALGLIAAGWPQLLQNRTPAAALSDIAAPPDVQRGLWFDLKKILLKEVAPSWAPCFD